MESQWRERERPPHEVDIIICFSVGRHNQNHSQVAYEQQKFIFQLWRMEVQDQGARILVRTLLQVADGWLFLVFSHGGEQSRSSMICLNSCKVFNPVHEGFILKTGPALITFSYHHTGDSAHFSPTPSCKIDFLVTS